MSSRRFASRLALAASVLALVAADPAAAEHEGFHWYGMTYSTRVGTACAYKQRVDPIGAIFHGTGGSWNYLGSYSRGIFGVGGRYVGNIQKKTYLAPEDASDQAYYSYGSCDETQTGSLAHEETPVSPGSKSTWRLHLRLWQQPGSHVPGKYQTAATPHMDQTSANCGNKHHVPPGPIVLPYGGTGSGFDYARQRLHQYYNTRNSRYDPHSVYWGNYHEVKQCDRRYDVYNRGYAVIIHVPR
jgi:hypothetical protein